MNVNSSSVSAMRAAYYQQRVEVAAAAKTQDAMEQQGEAAVQLIEAAGQASLPSTPLPGMRQGQNLNIIA